MILCRTLLFETPYTLKDGTKSVLFASQSALINLITDEFVEYKEKENSLQTALSLCLLPPTNKNFRRFSPKLINVILGLAEKKLKNSDDLAVLKDVMHNTKKKKIQYSAEIASDEVKFMAWTEKPADVYVFSDSPAELQWNDNSYAQKIINSLVNRLKDAKFSDCKFTFFVSNRHIAAKVWESLTLYLINVLEYSPQDASDLLLNSNRSEKIRIGLTEHINVVFHFEYFKLRSDNSQVYTDSALFNIVFKENSFSVSEQSLETTRSWAFYFGEKIISDCKEYLEFLPIGNMPQNLMQVSMS